MSPKPILYFTPRSPPCRAVLLTAAALNLNLELRLMNPLEGDHLTPEFLQLNPQHTIPVLDDNGIAISDSHVICTYLAEKYALPDQISLYPREQRLQIDARLYYDCGHLFPRLLNMAHLVIFSDADEISHENITYMQKAYDGLEYCLQQGEYLCGEHLTIADLCCVATVSSAELFAPIEEAKFPKLTAWLQHMKALPYYAESNKKGNDILAEFMRDKLEKNRLAKQA